MHSKTRKILYPIIAFIVIALIMTSCYSQSKGSEFSVGNGKMREGITSEPLYLGKEQLIHFDNKTGAHLYLTEYEIDEDGLYHITGNIDYVILSSDKKSAQERIYVSLRTQFSLVYQKEDGLRKIVSYQVQGLPGNRDVKMVEQSEHTDVQAQDLLSLEQPLISTLYVCYRDTIWDTSPDFTWQCEMMLDKNKNVILSLKPLAEEPTQ